MRYRYEMALEEMLDGDGKYSDLLKTSPGKFNLPENHKEDAIEEAIYNSFELGDTPAIRSAIEDVAKAIGAPFEVVLRSSQSHNI
jgi:predicted transcriptional regulator